MYFVHYLPRLNRLFGGSKDILFISLWNYRNLFGIRITIQERQVNELVYFARSTQSASDTFSAHEWTRRWSGLVRCLHF